jgi:hypothetical protein
MGAGRLKRPSDHLGDGNFAIFTAIRRLPIGLI